MSSRIALAATVVFALSASADAQPNRYQRVPLGRQPVIVQPAELQGTIQGIMPGVIVVIDTDNRPWQIGVQGAKVQVTGAANADFLHTGLTVEFSGTIDSHFAVKEKVGELKIVTPAANNVPGLFPRDDDTDATADADNKPVKRSKPGAITPGTYRIVGRLTVDRSGKLSVQAGRHKVSLELSKQPKIDVDVSDLSIAANGDMLTAKGFKATRTGVQAGGQFKANEVKIELAEPLAGTKKKGSAAKPEAKRPPKRSKPDGGLPEPAADR